MTNAFLKFRVTVHVLLEHFDPVIYTMLVYSLYLVNTNYFSYDG